MNKLILIPILIPFIWGCSFTPEKEIVYRDRIVEVKVPVPVQCPEPKELSELVLPINNIDDTYRDKPNEVGKAYIKSVRILSDRVEEQKKLLDVYRNQNGEDQAR